jgi:hypothetical protein
MLVFVIAAVVIFLVQLLYVFVFYDADKKFNQSEDNPTYDPRWSFNKKLNAKMTDYPQSVKWLQIYINVVLPALSVMSLYGAVKMIVTSEYAQDFAFFLHIFSVGLTLINTITIRSIDDFAFIINMIFMAVWVADIVISSGFIALMLTVLTPIAILNFVYFYRRKDLFEPIA